MMKKQVYYSGRYKKCNGITVCGECYNPEYLSVFRDPWTHEVIGEWGNALGPHSNSTGIFASKKLLSVHDTNIFDLIHIAPAPRDALIDDDATPCDGCDACEDIILEKIKNNNLWKISYK